MVIFGHRLFGKVDAVPNVGFVATRFFHIDYVPLVPTQCWLVFEQKGRSWRGVRIPFSFKSLLLAWLRPIALVAGVIASVVAVVAYTGKPHPDWSEIGLELVVAAVGYAVFAFLMMHKSVTRASYARAVELARLAKLNDAAMSALSAAYGQPPVSFGFQPEPVRSSPTAAAKPPQIAPSPAVVEVGEIDDGGAIPANSGMSSTNGPLAPPQAARPLRGY